MAQNLSKNTIIDYAISKGYSAKDINTALQSMGKGTYNPLTYSGNWKNMGGNAVKDIKEISRGLTTLGGGMLNSLREGMQGGNIQEKFLNAINSEPARRTIQGALAGAATGKVIPKIGTIGGGLIGGTAALLGGDRGLIAGGKDLVDAVLSTYNTSMDDIAKGKFDWRNAVQGAMEHPVYATTDLLPLGVKGVGAGGKAIASKTGMAQKIIPGVKQAELNRYLTNAKLFASQKTADLYKGYNALAKTPLASRTKIAEAITKGNFDNLGKEEKAIAKQLTADLRGASDILSDMGLYSKDFSRDNTVAQYAMANLLDTNLLHKDIMDIIEGKPLRATASKMFEDTNLKDRVLESINKGEELYDANNTAFLSQRLANSTDPLGEVIARYENLAEGTPSNYTRIIGRATPEQLGNVLDTTIKSQLDETARARQAIDVFANTINDNKLGIDIPIEERTKIINAFVDSLKKDASNGRQLNYLDALNNSGIDLVLKKQGNPVAYESLKGFFTTPKPSVTEDFTRTFKKNVLGTPGWSIGNRLGNWSLNAIEGVETMDYMDIAKYKDILPDTLKLQTSYNSYLNVGDEALKNKFKSTSLAKSATEFAKSFGKYKNSDRTIADKAKYISDLLGNISNATASPIFELEANFEYLDRAANYIRQAKRYAKKNKLEVADVLKKSKTDRELFNKLNNEVNRSLGDYFGRNYAMPNGASGLTSLMVPFYRFPVQTMRTTAHAIANHPARFASNVTIPARGGNVLSEAIMKYYGLDPDSYEGGVPYKMDDGSVRTLGMIPTPFAMVGPRFFDADKFTSMLNPLFGGELKEAIKYEKFGKTPTSPRYTAMKINNPLEAANYKPTVEERTGLILDKILGSTYNPYIWATRIAPQLDAALTGGSVQPFYNTMQSVKYKEDSNGKRVFEFEPAYNQIKGKVKKTRQNPEGYKKTLPIELIGNQFGISTKPNYPKKTSKTKIKQAMNQSKYTKKKIEKNR